MTTNPFSYGSPVHGDYFTGRAQEINEIVNLAEAARTSMVF